MITNTAIVSSFPCVRRSLFSDSFRSSMRDFSYALVIGNIVHDAFERMLIAQNFDLGYLEAMFRLVMKNHFCQLYQLGVTEDRVLGDLRLAATNV
jgi:hypothetical protein